MLPAPTHQQAIVKYSGRDLEDSETTVCCDVGYVAVMWEHMANTHRACRADHLTIMLPLFDHAQNLLSGWSTYKAVRQVLGLPFGPEPELIELLPRVTHLPIAVDAPPPTWVDIPSGIVRRINMFDFRHGREARPMVDTIGQGIRE